ncbi:MAG: toprim domain-containing protein [Solirubrobacteraceae bacterium]
MTPPDIRAFYAALGIQLPAWSTREAPTRCFANPDAHRRGDHNPSCSVSLQHGAWNCHGCGAHGGAYDAALATGHTPRSAMELLTSFGLAQRRASDGRLSLRTTGRVGHTAAPAAAPPSVLSVLTADEDDVRLWVELLDAETRLIRRLMLERAWSYRAIRELDVGFDGTRITIPIRSAKHRLRGVLRYDPFGRRDPKMLAVPGTRLGLIPHPAAEVSERVIVVEGPPDMIAARSCGLPASAIPGTSAWQLSWAQLLEGRRVAVVMDCDAPGRGAADEIANALLVAAIHADVVDLWPDRHDGYDLTDRILERRRPRTVPRAAFTIASLLRPVRRLDSKENVGASRSQEVAR